MNSHSSTPVITIDGPSGSGKGTVSAIIAQKLGYHFLDSGALYRLTGLAAEQQGVDFSDEAALTQVASTLEVVFQHQDNQLVILLSGNDVSLTIRNEETAALASKVASIQSVRDALLVRQRDFRVLPGLVADGRDMGTVVFTDATLKVFLTASSEERAKRRVAQLEGQGQAADYQQILSDIQARDDRDMNRSSSPLVPAEDALMIDSSVLSIEQVVKLIEEKLSERF